MNLFSCSDDLGIMAWNTSRFQAERGIVGEDSSQGVLLLPTADMLRISGCIAGHTGAVTSLVAAGGLLFSGAEDLSILVWGPAAGSSPRS
jgi:hypothetical protein